MDDNSVAQDGMADLSSTSVDQWLSRLIIACHDINVT